MSEGRGSLSGYKEMMSVSSLLHSKASREKNEQRPEKKEKRRECLTLAKIKNEGRIQLDKGKSPDAVYNKPNLPAYQDDENMV